MENVVAFNSELSSLYDSKPPISKAKMASITRAAMKAIKFYKHVVQSVEKFILKCKPEYKVPGLYVIDSIVRQSRHQFGAEKDVFAPRFARNMKQTFANLFRCASDDKSRIIRVLNLWQKNNVFAPEVIQPLFDLADPNHPIYQQTSDNLSSLQDLSSISNGLNTSQEINTSNITDDNHLHVQQSDISISHQTASALDQSTIRQLQQLQQILIRQTNENATSTTSVGGGGSGGGGIGVNSGVSNQPDSIKFNKKVLDYDYGEDEEDEKTASPHFSNIIDTKNLTQLLNDPNVLRQLQTLQKLKEQEEKQSKLKEMRIQEEAFEKHIQNVLKGSSGTNESHMSSITDKSTNLSNDGPVIEVINLEDGNDSRSTSPDRERNFKRRRLSRSRSRDRGNGGGRSGGDGRDRRRRSRSRSRSRSPRSSRRRSSRDRDRSSITREKEREKEREYERERRRKGLPDIKREHLTVCSNTLWVGHLSKLVHQEELSDTFGKYGDIISIDMIYPRGCAFIVMNRRQDAFKAMQNLKNHKLQGRAITISWAAGKGVKSKEWKDYWDLDLGVSYIPWCKLDHNTDLETLEEGGMFDEDTMPTWMKDKINQKKENEEKKQQQLLQQQQHQQSQIFGVDSGGVSVDTSQPPPTTGAMMPPSVPLIPPFSTMGPVPRMMPPPLGVPMGGSMVPSLPITPNMVPGMPPPHMMIPPPGRIVPGFTPMPGPMDKSMPPVTGAPPPPENPNSIPPSFIGPNMGNMHLPPHLSHQQSPFGGIGMPPQFPPAITNQPLLSSGTNTNQADDHMDIEMEDENSTLMNKSNMGLSGPQPSIFNQPPPLFSTFPNEMLSPSLGSTENNKNDPEIRGESDDKKDSDFGGRGGSRNRDSRDKHNDFSNKRDKEQNRWGPSNAPPSGDRNNDREKINNVRDFDRNNCSSQQDQGRPIPSIWQDNGSNFPPSIFGDNPRRNVMDMNIPPLDVNTQPHFQRLHFDMRRSNDFMGDDRRGFQQQQQRDFLHNMNLANMGRPPPQNMNRNAPMPLTPPFGPRLGPMFMRGSSRPGPAGFNFNERLPFDRDEGRGGVRGLNSDIQGRRNGRNNVNSGTGRGNSRFQCRDRDGPNDRQNRDRNDRGGGRDRDRARDRNREKGGRDRDNERDEQKDRKQDNNNRDKNSTESKSQNNASQRTFSNPPQDTEEDWDKELSDHNFEQQKDEQKQQQNFNDFQDNENLECWDSDNQPESEQNDSGDQQQDFDLNDQNNTTVEFSNSINNERKSEDEMSSMNIGNSEKNVNDNAN